MFYCYGNGGNLWNVARVAEILSKRSFGAQARAVRRQNSSQPRFFAEHKRLFVRSLALTTLPTLKMLALEARRPRPGSVTLVSRPLDIIFVQALRAWISTEPQTSGGWLGALREPQIGAALGLIHREPARAWNVEDHARSGREIARRGLCLHRGTGSGAFR